MKTCVTCKESKAFDAFHRDARKADGYRNECAACKQAKQREKYRTDDAHRERVKATTRRNVPQPGTPERQAWLNATRDYRIAQKAKYRRKAGAKTLAELAAEKEARATERAAQAKMQKAERASKQLHIAHVRAWERAKPGALWSHRYRTDPEFNAREKVRARMRKIAVADSDLQQHLSNELRLGRSSARWIALLGYTLEDLAAHLRRTLPKGARWEQFLSGELHIDHITPRAAFDLTDIDEVRACWSLGNLRLLCKHKNMAKGARAEVLL